MSSDPNASPQPAIHSRAKELFLEVCDLPADARLELIDERCGADPALREAVISLLRAHDQAGAFLPKPAPVSALGEPRQIGSYKLLELIGEGGFGSVYLAEQQQPVRRRVALKIIKAGMDTRQVIARFEAERQALAILDHANIARVFDAGATETGRPYFVMELVQGIPITRYCDQHNLSITQRLELFAQVCLAVQHAHQKGLIHRDIKPSNILISTQDDRPLVKVIDFGIAKATQSQLTEKTLFTELRQLIGTPEYMSPEQAGNELDIDTRSDVYSLGVLLYELLTGSTPFDGRELRSKAYGEMQRVIRDVEPPRPSTRLSNIRPGAPELPSVAACRATEPRKLNAMLRGELDWIVMKCLEKDRARRYQTAAELSADVARHLADEPVLAAAPSRTYRLRKFIRRHKSGVAASAAMFLLLVGGITGTSIGLVRESRQHAIADQQRAEAQRQSAEARRQTIEANRQAAIANAISEFQSDMLASADPEKLLGDKVTVLQTVSAAVRELDAGKLKDQPLVEASVRETIGNTLRALGRLDDAEPNLQKALGLRRAALPGSDPSIATALNQLAWLLEDKGQFAQAEPLLRDALKIRRSSLPVDHDGIAELLNNLAVTLKRQGKYPEAEALYRELLGTYPRDVPGNERNAAQAMNNLAMLLLQENKLAEAEPLFREALEMRRKALPAGHPDVAQSLNNLARLLQAQGKLTEAEPLYREALGIFRRAFPAGHAAIATSLQSLADLLRVQGKFAEAESLFRESLQMYRKSLPPAHPYIAVNLNNLALVFRAQGKLEDAEGAFREALAIRRKSLPAGHADIVLGLSNLANILLARGKFSEAESACREALVATESAQGKDSWQAANLRIGLGRALSGLNRFADAEEALLKSERVLASARSAPIDSHTQCVAALISLYVAWNASEPSMGYDAKAAHWRSMVSTTSPTTQSVNPSTSASRLSGQ